MKKFIYNLVFLLSISLTSLAQGVTPGQGVVRVASLPATCVAVGADGSSAPVRYQGRVYQCTSTNTWTAVTTTATGVTSITGTANQVVVTGTTTPTLSLPQSIATTSTPTFGGLTLTGAADSGQILGIKGLTKGLRFGTTTSGSVIQGVDSTLFTSYQPLEIHGSTFSFGVSGTNYFQLTSSTLARWDAGVIVSWGSSGTGSPDIGLKRAAAGRLEVNSSTAGTLRDLQLRDLYTVSLALSSTAPTVTSAGTSPSVTVNNGTASFRVDVGTGGTAHTVVLGMPTAANGWNCSVNNITAAAANRADWVLRQTASTTTSVTIQMQSGTLGTAQAFAANDIISCQCVAH